MLKIEDKNGKPIATLDDEGALEFLIPVKIIDNTKPLTEEEDIENEDE